MTTEQLLEDYSGGFPVVYAQGFSDAGRFGIRGEGTDIEDDQRDEYAAGVVKASQDRAEAFSTPWIT